MSEKLLFAGLVGVMVILAAASNWRRTVLIVMVLLVFEGALRKWVMPGAQAALYFAKDIVLLGAYLGFASVGWRQLRGRQASTLRMLCAVAAFYGAVQIFNPSSPSLLLGLVGWKSYFFYIPLAFMVPYLFRSSAELDWMLRRYLLIALPVAALGLLQFASPMDSAINVSVSHGEGSGQAVSFGGGEVAERVRTSGTFSYLGGYTEYLSTIAFLVIGLLTGQHWKWRGNLIPYLTLGAVLAAMFTTGSRGPIFTLVLVSPLYLWLAVRARDLPPTVAIRAAAGIVVGVVAVVYLFPEPIEAFQYRAAHADDPVHRMSGPFYDPLYVMFEGGILGFGTGTTHNSAGFITGASFPWWLEGLSLEGESGRIMAELGLPGFLLTYGIRVYLLVLAMKLAVTLSRPALRGIALTGALFFLSHIPGSVVNNPTADVFFWFMAGLLLLLMRLDHARVAKACQQTRVLGNRPAL